MTDMIAALCRELQLQPHPEGGYYREIYRSTDRVTPLDDRDARSSVTLIYYLLGAFDISRWHSVRSDEIWQHVDGAPLELLVLNADLDELCSVQLGARSGGATPLHVVRAGQWQAARPRGAYSLVSCAVAPGFDFADFKMLASDAVLAEKLRGELPSVTDLL